MTANIDTILATLKARRAGIQAPAAPVETMEQVRARLDREQAAWEAETIHEGYQIALLRLAFDAVKDRDNWKMPVAAPIQASERDIVAKAITFYTGSVARFSPLPGGRLLVEADGYYRAVGA